MTVDATTTITTTTRDRPGILLVHGFWHGAWCWSEVAARLTGRGLRVLAVDLPGHGLRAHLPAAATARPFDAGAFATEISPVAAVNLDTAGDLLATQIQEFAGGQPVVVVGHSFGGVVLTRAVQTVPELVHRAVYVAAIMPASGVPAVSYLQEPEQSGDRVAPLIAGDPGSIGALRLDVGSGGHYRAALREAFYADVKPDVADAAISLLTPDAPAALAAGATVLTADAWGSVPRTYVHTTQDWACRPSLQRRFVREADAAYPHNFTHEVELESGHSPFLSVPGRLADIIAAAAERTVHPSENAPA